ncbi:MAG: hypothetical protein AXA67_08920 [Methylothermaceae bacteria B42]|nr:MAG: hypothetical protein AXA67_08920 [Methylothermaceae bacteria B42]HHJ39425.1 FtsX-like permease family protein [Methylothermaceae bacterium]
MTGSSAGSSRSRQNRFRGQLQNYFRLHGHALFSSMGDLWRSPWMTGMTLLVIAISLILPATFYLALKNLQDLSGSFDETYAISLYLYPQVGLDVAQKLEKRLSSHPAITKLKLIDKQEALQEFQRRSGFGEAIGALEDNPLPIVIEVLPKPGFADPEKIQPLVAELQALENVEFAQWDMQWLMRLRALISMAQRGALLLGVLLSLGVVLIVGNTIRLELQDRLPRIEIMKILGATHTFIRRPFLYSGFWLGLIGGILALLGTLGVYQALSRPVARLSDLYQSQYSLQFLSFKESMIVLVFSVLISMMGAWLVVTRFLWKLRP